MASPLSAGGSSGGRQLHEMQVTCTLALSGRVSPGPLPARSPPITGTAARRTGGSLGLESDGGGSSVCDEGPPAHL